MKSATSTQSDMLTRKIRNSDLVVPTHRFTSGDGDFDEETDISNYKGEIEIVNNLSAESFTKSPVGRTLSSRSSQHTGITLQPPGPVLGQKSKKIGHRRVTQDGEVTYKKIETSQLIGSIQLGIHFLVGREPGIPDRDILMEDFLFIETVPFTRDGLLQKTPAHKYSDFKFRSYAPYAFRFFRHLFDIDTEFFLASLCSEPMVELCNPGVSGSIFYVTRDDNFICKTVQHKEADFLQKLLPGYYLNLQQNPRTLLPKFFGFYCYMRNAKNVRLVVMNNLLPSELRMHHKFDLKGSTYKRKASRKERSKTSPTFKDLDFMEMYPEGLLLQPDIYENLMTSLNRDVRVLESFKIMDYSLLIGIHNLDQSAKDQEFDAISDLLSDAESLNTGDRPSLERQGSVQYRERMIAHSTALESITMEIGEHAGPRPSIVGGLSTGTGDVPESGELHAEDGLDNVWGGIPAKNHRGENLLLFIGIIDILQEYGVTKKMEHYWKSLIHDGDTVSVHRPSFYAKRFKKFMSEKVFKKIHVAPRAGSSFRRPHVKRAMSKEGDQDQVAMSHQDSGVVSDSTPQGNRDSGVTVITIGANGQFPPGQPDSAEVCLPVVLQDRKRTPSSVGRSSVAEGQSTSTNRFSNRPDVIAGCSQTHGISQKGDDLDTGSIITMTSDERVQIYVPSPLETTPYNTVTRQSDQVRVSATATWASTTNVTVNGGTATSEETPFSLQKVAATNSYRSLTPLNMDVSDGQATLATQNITRDAERISLTENGNVSLEMVHISLNSFSDETGATKRSVTVLDNSSTQNQNSLSDKTLGQELPSLPADYEEMEAVSLSHIQLQDTTSANDP